MAVRSLARFVLPLLFLSVLASAQSPKTVRGVTMSDVRFDKVTGTGTLTLTNQSGHNVTAYALGETCQLADGTTSFQGTTEDYGPTAFTNKAFRLKETLQENFNCPAGSIGAHVAVIVAIYDNQTAEVTDTRTFQDMVALNRGIAHALQQLSDAMKNPETAQQKIEAVLADRKAGKNDANEVLLQQELDNLKRVPPEQQRTFIQFEASRLQHHASLQAQHATVRRLP